MEQPEGQTLAYLVDAAIKWGEALMKDKEPLLYAIGEEPILGFKYEDAHPDEVTYNITLSTENKTSGEN